MKNYVILLAGGVGSRMKADMPKQFIEVNEKPIIVSSPQKKQTVITIKGQANNLSITCSEEAGRYLAESIKEIIKKWDGFSL